MNFDVPYAMTTRIRGARLQDVRPRTTEALKAEGFGVLTEIDVAATLEAKLGVKRPPYVILGACNPKLANEALEREPAIGLLLPCNVVLAQDGDDVVVSAASPRAMFGVVRDQKTLENVAADAEARLQRAIAAIGKGATT